ncbi:ABC transporter ATP-binding protein [Paenibacillus alginolyticus]|uniref:ABC transporter ATP-binding protein/permease n=1 Tax=Paenibacillus alginolyticus TaxID=59839 RepID=A0ABT4GCK1_9BACL|nr:ABC transporter ATP-binding protein [Paenibacillus alginolyticus]MCY9693895.1 ABC transporter ATP-binding protein/permease [Paenibacillus alginolyticus]MEC0145147.1 ABC transporter ATP-binding protein [Paenibacillus alginolyticus]
MAATRKEELKVKSNWRGFARLLAQANPPKLVLSIALGLSIISTLVGLVIPLFTKNVVDSFSVSSLNWAQISGMAIAFVASAVASGISVYLLNFAGQRVVAGIRDRLWKKLLVLPVRYYDNHQTGDTISRMTNDTAVIKGLIAEHMAGFVTGIISIIGSIVVLLFMDWKMTLIMFSVFPIAFVILFPLGRQMFKISKGMQAETASFTSVLNRVLSEMRLVKAANAEPVEYKEGAAGIQKLFKFGLKEGRIQALMTPLVTFVMLMLFVVLFGYGGMQVASGAISAGQLVAFMLYLFQIVAPITQITQFFNQVQKAMGATDTILKVLDYEEENPHAGVPVTNASQSIYFDQVSFSYKEGESVLKNVSFTMEAGKVTAIVGPSGSGKTTMFSLLERFYAPQKGSVTLGSDRIDQFSLISWRSQIGYVSQESPLIAGTIRDNICYGLQHEVTMEELKRASQMAYADDFIEELPQKYETEVGERGIKLSGGQRQRIAIARALLRDPKILMLDEATSSLDSKSEVVVQQALQNLMQGRTTLVIAHRLSTVVDAEQIIFLDKGVVTGSGTHQQLLESHEMYREFATQQLQLQDQMSSDHSQLESVATAELHS